MSEKEGCVEGSVAKGRVAKKSVAKGQRENRCFKRADREGSRVTRWQSADAMKLLFLAEGRMFEL